MSEQRRDVPAAAQHSKNHDTVAVYAVDDDVIADRKAPESRTQVVISGTPYVGMAGKKKEPIGNGVG
jgi:hypothetical protein